ncbi:hypothetical protein EVAR_98732_1 [Eumeta japonica]|uniref:Uncharacterized protein n=1 Tax=Eumeta variegata TaxID=151549 RepID=A0A4C1ZMS3_EUMVA|nr:hypothetical protein EVAR_98732_1 [Eumeta japonica]
MAKSVTIHRPDHAKCCRIWRPHEPSSYGPLQNISCTLVYHAVVAIPRHTVIFYTDDGEVGIFVNRALAASDKKYHNNAKWLSLIRTEKSWISWKTDEEDSSTKTKLQAIP